VRLVLPNISFRAYGKILEVSFRSRKENEVSKIIATVMISGGAKDGDKIKEVLTGKHRWEI